MAKPETVQRCAESQMISGRMGGAELPQDSLVLMRPRYPGPRPVSGGGGVAKDELVAGSAKR